MTSDPVVLLTKLVPAAFNAGIADMQKAAEGGDEKSKQKLANVRNEPFAAKVVLEGDDDTLFLAVENGTMACGPKQPATAVRIGVALPKEALEVALGELGDKLQRGLAKAQAAFARLSVARIKPVFEKLAAEKLRFHLVVKDTPDFDEVRVKIAVGEGEPPQKPAFTVSVDYEAFEKIRRGQVKPQAILGTLQITGDSARAMQLAMELMQGR